jgi:hypothetical protein
VAHKQQDAEQDEHEPIDREGKDAEGDRSTRDRDRRHERTESEQGALGEDEADAPCHDQGAEFAAVEMPHDQPFQHHTKKAHGHRRKQHGKRQRHAPMHRDTCRIGAEHHEFAMRQVDDVHHAQDDNEPERRQEQEGSVGAELVEQADRIGHGVRPT